MDLSVGEVIIQQLINGLVLGAFYALVALGYSMVYGIIKLLNFAHGDIYMIGAFICFSVFSVIAGQGVGAIILSMLASMVFCALLGFVIQRVAYRPLLGAPRLSMLITAVGVDLVLYNAVMVITGGDYKFFIHGLDATAGISIGNISISWVKIVLILVAALVMIVTMLFINRTMWGKAMRAISLDQDTCRLMGINVNSIIAITFCIGSSMAAIAGSMACVYYGNLHYFMGYLIGIKAFTAAVIGGIGSIPGAMLGGILLGILEAFGTLWLGSAWKDVFAFVILILILVLKPNGLLGKTEIERM